MDSTKAITSKEMMEIEQRAHEMGVTRLLMMENSGAGIAYNIVRVYNEQGRSIKGCKVVVICGLGNNGGDAMVSARHLAYHGADVTVILLGSMDSIKTEEARSNYNILARMRSSIKLIEIKKHLDDDIKSIINSADLIVDGIFGTGIRGDIKDPYASAIDAINSSRAYKVAVDIPSGLDPDTGYAYEKCVKADLTITFHRLKNGLLIDNGKTSGNVIVWNIGIPPEAEQ